MAPLPAAAQPDTATATGECAVAINAGDYNNININCFPEKWRKLILELVKDDKAQDRQIASIQIANANQNQTLQLHTQQIDQLQQQNQNLAQQVALLGLAILRLEEQALKPGASAEVKQAYEALSVGDVRPAAILTGKQAELSEKLAGEGSQAKATNLYLQQAALLQTTDPKAALAAALKAVELNPEDRGSLTAAAQLAAFSGDLATAAKLQERILTLVVKEQVDSDDPLLLQERGMTLTELGTLRLTLGDRPGAESAMTDALAAFTELSASDVTNLEWQQLRSRGLAAQADVLLAKGETAKAVANVDESLAISRDLLKASPNDATRFEVVSRLQKLAFVQSYTGNHAKAHDALTEAIGLLDQVIASSPLVDIGYASKVFILGQLAYYDKIGGDPKTAIENFRKAIDVAQSRLALAPTSPFWQNNLLQAYLGLADAQLSRPWMSYADKTNFTKQALASYDEAQDLATKLAAENPENPIWQFNVWAAISGKARAKAVRGQLKDAASLHRAGIESLEAMIAKRPEEASFQGLLGSALGYEGQVLAQQGKLTTAMASFDHAVEAMKSGTSKQPDNAAMRNDFALVYDGRANIREMIGQGQEAISDFRSALDLREKLLEQFPANNPWRWQVINSKLLLSTKAVPTDEKHTLLNSARALAQQHMSQGNTPPLAPGLIAQIDAVIATLVPAT